MKPKDIPKDSACQRAPGSHPKFGSFEDFCSQCRDECPLASTPRALLPRRPHAALGGLLRDHEDRYAPLGWPRGVVPPRAIPSLQVFVCGRGSSTLCGAQAATVHVPGGISVWRDGPCPRSSSQRPPAPCVSQGDTTTHATANNSALLLSPPEFRNQTCR